MAIATLITVFYKIPFQFLLSIFVLFKYYPILTGLLAVLALVIVNDLREKKKSV